MSPLGIRTRSLSLECCEAPWDTAALGRQVFQITKMKIFDAGAGDDFAAFEVEMDRRGAFLVSCRLPGDRLRESMLLEEKGFRFVEMVFQPALDRLDGWIAPAGQPLDIELATPADLPEIMAAAASAFGTERFHVDHRLDRSAGDRRYVNWVVSSLEHPTQRLHAIREHDALIAFFVIEMQEDATCYWHLTAVAPRFQGKGYGRKTWQSMIMMARELGARRIRTTIAARNFRVLNLYSRLGFAFGPPQMTFHWVRPEA